MWRAGKEATLLGRGSRVPHTQGRALSAAGVVFAQRGGCVRSEKAWGPWEPVGGGGERPSVFLRKHYCLGCRRGRVDVGYSRSSKEKAEGKAYGQLCCDQKKINKWQRILPTRAPARCLVTEALLLRLGSPATGHLGPKRARSPFHRPQDPSYHPTFPLPWDPFRSPRSANSYSYLKALPRCEGALAAPLVTHDQQG